MGRNLKGDARRLGAFSGEKKNRLGVIIQMPGIGARARPTIPLVLHVAVYNEITPRFDARDLRLKRSPRPTILDAHRAEGGQAAAGPDTSRTTSQSQTSQRSCEGIAG